MTQPVVNHRGPEFRALYAHIQELVKPVLGTRNSPLFFASSGTGMMEASLVNILALGERLLIVVNGQFGERFAAIGNTLGARVDILEVPWGGAVDPAEIADRLGREEYRAVVVVHNESSTGVVNHLAAIGRIVRDHPALLVVDSVSGLGGLEMRQDEWGIDVVVSASQKCLSCPPGIGLLSLSSKAQKAVQNENRLPRYYWDLRKAMASGEKCETPFTPPVSLIAGLKEALEMIHEEGIPQVWERHGRLTAALRSGCEALGLATFGQTDALSNTVVVVNVPDGINGSEIVRLLYERRRTVIAGARNKLAGKVLRFGIMGSVCEADILRDLEYLEEALGELGRPVNPGAGVTAARAALSP
jgi:aspartate aminotransferase-like enzyme